MLVRIILSQTSKIDRFWLKLAALKGGEIGGRKSLGNFDSAIGAKIKVNDTVARFNFADGLIFLCNDERWEILVLQIWFFVA